MKLVGCNYELWRQTKVSKGKNTNGNQFGKNPCNTRMVGDFWQSQTLDVQGQRTSFYMPTSISPRSFQDLNTSISNVHNLISINIMKRPLNLHMWFFKLVVDTWRTKLTWPCLCESPSNLESKFCFVLQKPKISPSICVILVVKYEFGAYFIIVSTNYFKSLD